MRSEQEVQDRIRYLLTREVEQRFALVSQKLPFRCIHNERHRLDGRKTVRGEHNEYYNRLEPGEGVHLPVVGLCMLGAEDPGSWPGNLCEDPQDAQACPFFTPKDSLGSVQAEFQAQIQDLVWVEKHLPEVYGLLWALGSETVPRLPWWKRVWYRFLSVRPDPLIRRKASLTAGV